jgi:adenylate cyclase
MSIRPSKVSAKNLMRFLSGSLIPLLLTLFAVAGLWVLARKFEPAVSDMMMRATARPARESPVVLALIDDASLQLLEPRFGPPPWKRQAYLELFRRIQRHQPAVIVFDSHFMETGRTEDQHVFKELKAFGGLVNGLAVNTVSPETASANFYGLNVGIVNTEPDADGVVRAIRPYREAVSKGAVPGVFPSLSLAGAYEYLVQARGPAGWTMSPGDRVLSIFPEADPSQGIHLPLNQQERFLIRWQTLLPDTKNGYARSHPAVSVWRLFEAQEPADLSLAGKIVLVGASSAVYRDYHPTPMTPQHLGADIHATAIDNILQGQVMRRVPDGLQWLVQALLFLAVFLLRLRLQRLGHTVLYTAGLMILYLWLAFHVYSHYGLMPDILLPEMLMVVALLAGSTWRISSRDRQVRALERKMAQLVSQSVFQEIQRLGDFLAPGGERQEITSMFVDIRNFTAIAEHLPDTELTQLLNEFYTVVEAVIFTHHGTVDKFMGDGVLIMFGAPLPDERHADTALAAAKDTLTVTEELTRRWRERMAITVEIGISLSTGQAFVGFLGPLNKLEYTAVGDTVNLCIRLQSQMKRFKTRIIISEFTASRLTGDEPLEALGDVTVRGRESGLKVYTLAGQRERARSHLSAAEPGEP